MDWLEYHEEPVTLSSGRKSHWLVRGDIIFADENLRNLVLDVWERCLRHDRNWLVLGVPRGGIPWAKALADRTNGTYIEPNDEVPDEGPVAIVDDVLTTGNSLDRFRPDIVMRVTLVVVNRLTGRTPGGAWAHIHLPS